MIDLVKKIFSADSKPQDRSAANTGRHDIRVAACALLLEMASIDGEFSAQEHNNIISALRKNFQLPDEIIDDLIAAARAELKSSVDLWQFTNLINQNYSDEEKCQIIETIWAIAYADGRLDRHEDYLAHKLANLLRLNHKKLIEAKLKVIRPKKTEPAV